MTNKLQQITTLALATILIAGSFSLTPFAYSTGWNDDDDDDDSNQIKKGLCKDPNNKIVDGCFEAPTVTNSKGWDIFEMNNDGTHNNDLGWKVAWQEPSPCSVEPGLSSVGLLELQKNILGGPAEQYQHAELDSDCNGPNGNGGGQESTSVAISQTVATLDNYDYKITFAYKARPNQPMPTNGLLVTWNGEILADNLPFSMKEWKYFSKTVSGTTGSIPLSFIDTGEPNSFGTFLDDVSVIPIKKPMSSITLIKAYTNDNSGTASPIDFTMKIKKVGGTTEIPIPHTSTVEVPTGTYTISETNPDPAIKGSYSSVLVTGDDECPKMLENSDNNLDEFTLKKGEHITCIIYNDDNADGQSPTVDPPTITIVNNVSSDPQPFDLTVSPIVGAPEVVNPTTTKYTVDSHTKVTISGSEDRSILITGDGNCPENNGGFVNIENGQDITCIYSDRPVVEQNGPGVIFHYDTLSVVPVQVSEDVGDCMGGAQLPCIAKSAGSTFYIFPDFTVDDSDNELTQTSLILLTVLDVSEPRNSADCRVTGVDEDSQAFLAVCPGFNLDIESDIFNFNWAIIETNPDA